ncbi:MULTISPECIES: hypothetical protein [Acinetobacter]|nr:MULTISPECIES: hypothetical protein [Acinetobacter]EKT9248022.1 hypothetical protein [Acinetobacter baumannii]EKV8039617.1 hypothetical protein [Acinetobacter baumannii]ENV65172.1 hypothetical protein F949_00071 [Acinetobacter junii NIPH 182]MBE2308771.1 hypothetical protein [Acinetobacter baumannii]MBE2623483.1 hypothetical protein [Acinetobacter baumannii]
MQLYGTVKTHKEQRKFRLNELLKSYLLFVVTVLIVSFFIWMYIGGKYMNVLLPFVLFSGFVMIAFNHLKDLTKIYDKHVELLMLIGQKNPVFINTLDYMLKKNGSVNAADLKGLMSEIYWENKYFDEQLFNKAIDKNSMDSSDRKISEIYIKYTVNRKILECIKTILKTEYKD